MRVVDSAGVECGLPTPYQRVSSVFTLPVSGTATAAIACPAGKRVFGGGIDVETTRLSGNQMSEMRLLESFSSSDTVWRIHIHNRNDFSVPATMWAVCASVQ